MNYYEIGQRIRKYRKAKKLTQEKLAELADISVTHMSHIESGNTKLSLPVLVSLSEILDVQTDDLLRDQAVGRNVAMDELSETLDACSTKQVRIVVDTVKALKVALDKHENVEN